MCILCTNDKIESEQLLISDCDKISEITYTCKLKSLMINNCKNLKKIYNLHNIPDIEIVNCSSLISISNITCDYLAIESCYNLKEL